MLRARVAGGGAPSAVPRCLSVEELSLGQEVVLAVPDPCVLGRLTALQIQSANGAVGQHSKSLLTTSRAASLPA